jgi:phage tail sheath gpL-like
MGIINPKVSIQILPAFQTVQNDAQKILIIGQQTSGTATSGVLEQNIGNQNEQDTLFGQDSMIAAMIRRVKEVNKINQVDAIGIDDNGTGVDATGTIVFSGTATAAGTITVVIGSERNHKYELPVAIGDTATDIGDALVNATTLDTIVPVILVNTVGSVASTAIHAGLSGNDISLKVTGTVAGITYSVTAMSGGSVDPDISGIFTQLANIRYQTVIFPSSYATQVELKDFLDDRFNPDTPIYKILDGVGITTKTGTFAELVSTLDLLDSQNFVIFPNRTKSTSTFTGSALVELDYVISANIGAIRALRLSEGTSISNYVDATQGSLDAFGGIHISTLPYHNTPMELLPLIDPQDMWINQEQSDLEDKGIAMIGNNINNTEIILGTVVTRYLSDAAGNPDLSFKYLNYVDQASAYREYFHNNLRTTFKQSRLTTGDITDGYNIANEGIIRAECVKLFTDLGDVVVAIKGEDARKFFLENLAITIDEITGTVSIRMYDPVVTQIRKILATMQLTFTV